MEGNGAEKTSREPPWDGAIVGTIISRSPSVAGEPSDSDKEDSSSEFEPPATVTATVVAPTATTITANGIMPRFHGSCLIHCISFDMISRLFIACCIGSQRLRFLSCRFSAHAEHALYYGANFMRDVKIYNDSLCSIQRYAVV